jgi:hypothetical protein
MRNLRSHLRRVKDMAKRPCLVLALLCGGVWFLVRIMVCMDPNDLRSSRTYHSLCKCTYRSHRMQACLLLEMDMLDQWTEESSEASE